jgi:hypothetical protein
MPVLISELPKSNCSRWSSLFAEFNYEAFRLCPALKCVSCMALLYFAGGSFKAV